MSISIDWSNFTPISSLFGGILIGIAASLLWITLRKTAGISGIVGDVLIGKASTEGAWRLLFLSGLVAAPWLVTVDHLAPRFGVPMLVLCLAGFLTGFGTRLARGCTSGHGVCGLSRFSPRSLIAVIVFMAAGMATVTAIRATTGT